MNYPEELCAPMREDLTQVGYLELKSAEAVENILANKEGTVLIIVNSVCGCAAGNARPAAKMATEFEVKPTVFATVFVFPLLLILCPGTIGGPSGTFGDLRGNLRGIT